MTPFGLRAEILRRVAERRQQRGSRLHAILVRDRPRRRRRPETARRSPWRAQRVLQRDDRRRRRRRLRVRRAAAAGRAASAPARDRDAEATQQRARRRRRRSRSVSFADHQDFERVRQIRRASAAGCAGAVVGGRQEERWVFSSIAIVRAPRSVAMFSSDVPLAAGLLDDGQRAVAVRAEREPVPGRTRRRRTRRRSPAWRAPCPRPDPRPPSGGCCRPRTAAGPSRRSPGPTGRRTGSANSASSRPAFAASISTISLVSSMFTNTLPLPSALENPVCRRARWSRRRCRVFASIAVESFERPLNVNTRPDTAS